MTEDKTATTKKAAPKAEAKDAKAPKKAKFNTPFSLVDPLQSKVVNCIMKCGKKTIAQRILKDSFAEIFRRGEQDVQKTFEKAIKNATPTIEVRPRRIGGSVYQVPTEVTAKRQQTLAIRWILDAARKKSGQPMAKRLASELLDAANERGTAFSKREEMHRMAQSNKAFAHLARY